jgi:nucleoside-diphosphate-sugar epimerase
VSAPVAVTGATGYVASHVVRELLGRGLTVHATARDPADDRKVGHLARLASQLPGELRLFRADLFDPAGLAAAFDGCGVVVHTASPFVVEGLTDPDRQLVQPALEGTRNVLDALPASVERVVLTSSIAALMGDSRDVAGRVLDEASWNTTSSLRHRPYYYSKTVAERLAWERAGRQGRWRLVTINPGFVMGPSLTARGDSTSVDFLLKLIDGRLRVGVWDEFYAWVDVREVAFAHAEAVLRPDADGRHLLAAEARSWWDLVAMLDEDVPEARVPRRRLPRLAAFVVGPPNGFSWRYVARNVGIPFAVDNSRSRARLGVVYRPIRETLRDHVAQLRADGLFPR